MGKQRREGRRRQRKWTHVVKNDKRCGGTKVLAEGMNVKVAGGSSVCLHERAHTFSPEDTD